MAACVIQPTEMLDAGPEAGPIPPECDEFGGECKACQACVEVQELCAPQIKACNANSACIVLGKCNDQCDSDTTDAGISKCKAKCCDAAMSDASAVKAYTDVAACLYGRACPNTCVFQHDRDTCGGQ
jgi:hypothetical protein